MTPSIRVGAVERRRGQGSGVVQSLTRGATPLCQWRIARQEHASLTPTGASSPRNSSAQDTRHATERGCLQVRGAFSGFLAGVSRPRKQLGAALSAHER